MITYRDVEVRFDEFVAIPDLNLTVGEGEFFTLLGPSGCGKTTALRALAGFIIPTAGEITIADKVVTKLAPDKREIGMVFQNYALFPSMTVFDNIAFGLKVARVSKAEVNRRVREIAAQVDLSGEHLAKGIAALSGGQQQRVAIARALVLRPKILLLDEPLSNLDAKLRHQLRGQLKDLQAQFGITTVYVTHDQEEALTMSDRVAVMNAGHIEQAGTPEEIYNASATEFVCRFIGDANVLGDGVLLQLRSHGVELAPDRPAYLRVERAQLCAPDANPQLGAPGQPAGVRLKGTVVSRSFHGLYVTYRVDVSGDVLKVVTSEGLGAQRLPGQHVEVIVHPEHILQYAGSA